MLVIQTLFHSFQCNTFVETLDLSDNGLPPDSWPFIAEVISENYYVTTLHLAGNGLGSRLRGKGDGKGSGSAIAFAGGDAVSANAAKDKSGNGLAALATALAENRFLISLDLSRNELDDEAGQHLER